MPKSGVKNVFSAENERGEGITGRERGVRYWNVRVWGGRPRAFGPKTAEKWKMGWKFWWFCGPQRREETDFLSWPKLPLFSSVWAEILHEWVSRPGDFEFGVRSAWFFSVFFCCHIFSGIFPPHLHWTDQLISHSQLLISNY